MGYATRLEGALWLHPFPAEGDVPTLREELAALATTNAGRLSLTPLGHGLVFEDTYDWEAALEAVERARGIFGERGVVVGGALRAIGEDDTLLATIAIDAEGVHVERHEVVEDEEGDDDDEDEDDDDDDESDEDR